MSKKNLLSKFCVITLPTINLFPTIVVSGNNKVITNKNRLNSSPQEVYEQKVSKSIKRFLELQKFAFYNIDDFKNLNELNQWILPILLKKLENVILQDENEDLIFNGENLSIFKFVNLTEFQLTVELKYSTTIFATNLTLISEIDDNNLAQAIKSLFEKEQFINQNLLTFCEWEKTIEIFNQTSQWIKQKMQLVSLKINNKITMINSQKLDIFLIDLDQWQTSQNFF